MMFVSYVTVVITIYIHFPLYLEKVCILADVPGLPHSQIRAHVHALTILL